MTTTIEHTDFRSALGDDLLWRILTSDEEGREAATAWLREASTAVRADRKARKARLDAQQHAAPRHTKAWHQAHAAFVDWEARSRGFEKHVLRRLRELGMNEQGHPVGGRADAALERARRHATYCEEQMRHAVGSLADLASLVEAHIAGAATVAELDQALDDLTVYADGRPDASLRELLAGKRAAYATPEAVVVP